MSSAEKVAEPPVGAPSDANELADPPDPRRWKALGVLAVVQVMLLLDATVVNVALPSVMRDLGMSASGLTWVVSSYLLAAGCLLLIGGKIADLFGRRRVFFAGTGIFAVASLVAGVAQNPEMLIFGRVLQGVGEALAAPAALSLVTLLFTSDKERPKAFGIWGSLAGLGSTLGVLLGGILVHQFSWRAVFLINLVIVAVVLPVARKLVDESRVSERPKFDVRGAIVVALGLVSLIHGLLTASEASWVSADVLVPVGIGIVLLAAFVALEKRSDSPMIPMQFFKNRTRAIGYCTIVTNASASAAVFFVLVLYMQNILGYSPLMAGLAWLPFCIAFMPGLFMSMQWVAKTGIRRTLFIGLVISAVGVGLMARLPVDGYYWLDVLPAMLVTAFGFGVTAPAMQNAATSDLGQDAGLGSGVVNTVQQLGQALGLAVLVTAGLMVTQTRIADGGGDIVSQAAGYQVSFIVAALVLGVGAVVGPLVVREPKAVSNA